MAIVKRFSHSTMSGRVDKNERLHKSGPLGKMREPATSKGEAHSQPDNTSIRYDAKKIIWGKSKRS